MGAGWETKAGSEETKEKFYLSCNNRPLKKKKERENFLEEKVFYYQSGH